MGIARELKQMQKKWKRSKARSILKPVPDGKYRVRFIDCRLEKSKSSDRLQIAETMQIIKGKYRDRMLYRYPGLESTENISYYKKDLKTLGIKVPKNMVNLTRAIEKCIDLVCKITIRTRGEFTNIFIDELVEDEE